MPNKASDRRRGADPPKNESERTGTFCPEEERTILISAGNGLSISANSSNKDS